MRKNSISAFIGDKIGYRNLMIANALVMAASSTCFDLTPRFSQEVRSPVAVVYPIANRSSNYSLHSIDWPICDMETNVRNCEDSFMNLTNFDNLGDFLSCTKDDPTFHLEEDFIIESINATKYKNGSFCVAEADIFNEYNVLRRCDILEYPGDCVLHHTISIVYKKQ